MTNSNQLKRCTKCLLPETHETIRFNEQGVCNICENQEYKKNKIDWVAAKAKLDEIIENNRGKYEYDCIVPFSGGKDSTWTLYYLVKHYKLRPLVARFDHGFYRPNLQENTTKVLRKLGVDFVQFTPNWKMVQKLMLQAFLEKGDFCWHCHTGIVCFPLQTAVRYKVPLVIYGEPSAEYTAYYTYKDELTVNEERFNRVTNLGINADDMFIKLGANFDPRDLNPFTFPPKEELRKIGYQSIYLGAHVPWDVKKQSEIIMKELDWKGDRVENVDPNYSYEKIECYMQGVRDYIKYIKRGYSRNSHLAALDLRNGRIDSKRGAEMVEEDGKRPPSLDLFLKFIGLTEEEFNEIAARHGISPYQHDFDKTRQGEKLKDFNAWSQEGEMPKETAQELLQQWKKRER